MVFIKGGAVVERRPLYASLVALVLSIISALRGFLKTIFQPDAAADYKRRGGGGGGGGSGGGSSGGGGGSSNFGNARPRIGGMGTLKSNNPSTGGCCGGGCG